VCGDRSLDGLERRARVGNVPPRLWCPVVGLVFVLSCTSEVTLVPASGSPGDTDTTHTDTTHTDTTVARRATLNLTVRVATSDTAFARLLGWIDGVIAGATVKGFRIVGGQGLNATTDDQGRASFPGILEGTYQVSVSRLLSSAERALLGPENADKVIFSGAEPISVSAPSTSVELAATLKATGGLVISEVFPATWTGTQSYRQGDFLEVYNNSDTTIYLDGKLVGLGTYFDIEYPQYDRPCSVTQQWQADPDGLWSTGLWRFPGTGQQYPLAPGEAAVLATDAVDHSLVDPRWPNLSTARFEFIGPADVDNPAAANMQLVFTPWSDPLGHGPAFDGDGILFIANNLDIDTLPTVQPPNFRLPIPRVPRDAILDVVTFMIIPSFYVKYGFQLCPVLINGVFDAGPAFFVDAAVFMSLRRHALGTVLLRSGSTVNDFEIAPRPTPGVIP
jgi:hypothetical protein